MSLSRETIAAFRFGYGPRPGEAVTADPDRMLTGVARGAAVREPADPTFAARMQEFEAIRAEAAANGGMPSPFPRYQAIYRSDVEHRVVRTALSPHGFCERLVWFWADHFTAVGKNARGRATVPSFEVEAIRPNVAGRFADLLRAAVTHPVMLAYLDQTGSIGPNSPVGRRRNRGLNENLAREVLELHTLGVEADYGQDDVRAFAELLTGLGTDGPAGGTVFRPKAAEPGAETLLGRRYGSGQPRMEDILRALDDLAVHPATARHVGRKLAVHFVADQPPPDLVDHLAATFSATDGDLMAVYAALLEHPAAWAEPGAKVRQPFDFLVASLRATGPQGPDDLAPLLKAEDQPPLARSLTDLNQAIWRAPGPDGWPEVAEAWITAPGLSARLNWASRIGNHLAERTDPRAFLEAALGERARKDTRFLVQGAAERWEGIALVLAAPEFNRR